MSLVIKGFEYSCECGNTTFRGAPIGEDVLYVPRMYCRKDKKEMSFKFVEKEAWNGEKDSKTESK